MAKGSFNFPFSGSLGDYSMYTMKGVDKVIIRAKGGPTGYQIKHYPQFIRVRENNSEFAGVAKTAANINTAMHALKHLRDFPFKGNLVKVSKIIQKNDLINYPGTRIVELSKYKDMLEGFNLNKNVQFDSIVRRNISCDISKEDLSVRILIPELNPKVNLKNEWKLPLYRFIVQAGIVPDMIYQDKKYVGAEDASWIHRSFIKTDWLCTSEKNPSMDVMLNFPDSAVLNDSSTIIVSIGIEFGSMITKTIFEAEKGKGCAKILAVG